MQKIMLIKGSVQQKLFTLSTLILNNIDMALYVTIFHFVWLFLNSQDTVGTGIKRNFKKLFSNTCNHREMRHVTFFSVEIIEAL